MLSVDKQNITETSGEFQLPNGVALYAKTLMTTNRKKGKLAIFIHGGGSGGNHTIVYRPSCWLLNKGHFSTIILPDRRGAANSSPITSVMTYEDNAQDMKLLLDCMGIEEKITAIGISYGGPIALTLAAIDKRVDQVILIASSPSLKPARGIIGFLYHKGLLEKMVEVVYRKFIGKLGVTYPDFDGAYDATSVTDLKKIFLEAIQHTDNSRLQSLLLENASTCNIDNAGINSRHTINVPVLRVIGTRDETWEIDLKDKYSSQIPDIKTQFVLNAGHKDVFFKATEFYEALDVLLL